MAKEPKGPKPGPQAIVKPEDPDKTDSTTGLERFICPHCKQYITAYWWRTHQDTGMNGEKMEIKVIGCGKCKKVLSANVPSVSR